jgi:glycosyltransferase involved in cell wall biosynthesis
VGRLARPKGFDLAIEAVAALRDRGRDARLVLVGDGPEREALAELVRARALEDRVTLTGSLNHDELLPYYRSAWLLVAPSRVMPNGRRDGIPNVVVEALAMGLPCVGTRAAGLEEAIEADVNGALVPPDDPRALAGAIEPLLRSPARIDAMGEEARGRVAAQFDAERNFERLYALMANGVGR